MKKNIFIAIVLLALTISLPCDAKPQGLINVSASITVV